VTPQEDVQRRRRVLSSGQPAGPEPAVAGRSRIRMPVPRRAAAALLLVTGLGATALLVPGRAETQSLQLATTAAPPWRAAAPARTSALDEEKRALLEQQGSVPQGDAASKRVAAQAGRPPRQAPGPPDRGIVEDREAPISSSVFVVGNRWTGAVDGSEVAVYAGRSGQDERRGMVLVSRLSADGRRVAAVWLHEAGTGALRVAAARGPLLTLSAATGDRFVLDLRDARPGLRPPESAPGAAADVRARP